MSRLISAICWWVVRTFPGRYRIIGDNGTPYLGRFYVKHNGFFPGIYLHHFYRSDHDRELHNHPWKWSVSLVLTGGYTEERYEATGEFGPDRIQTLNRPSPGINIIRSTTFHRVVLKDKERGAWTLFIPGPESKDWGFLDRETGKYTSHATFLGSTFVDVAPNRTKI